LIFLLMIYSRIAIMRYFAKKLGK